LLGDGRKYAVEAGMTTELARRKMDITKCGGTQEMSGQRCSSQKAPKTHISKLHNLNLKMNPKLKFGRS